MFFAIPFTFDTSFNLGLYAYTFSSNGSFGASFTVNNNQSLFQNTVALDGIDEVLAGPGDTPVTNYNIAAASGLNYTESQVPTTTVPEPATWALLIVGSGLIGLLRRRFGRKTAGFGVGAGVSWGRGGGPFRLAARKSSNSRCS